MKLEKYKAKRNFEETPEPTGGKPDNKVLRFVIQKHDASHLHYDFRLEMEGVLKSWAVPKGPSMDHSVKRLAMMVEDHPYDYRSFEGIIPSGYGAGTVIVWDEGTYEPVNFDSDDKKAMDKELRRQLHAGKIHFVLHGEKLKGEFALVKAHGRGENSWLLMKLEDEYETKSDILKKDQSVLSGKTLEKMEREPENIYGRTAEKKSPEKTEMTLAKVGKPEKLPETFSPMLATLTDKPFSDPDWIFEAKWDGYRAIAILDGKYPKLFSRNDKSFEEKFYPVFDALKEIKDKMILDGEIVVIGEDGKSNFGELQNWRSETDGDLQYIVFDILHYNGRDLTGLPLLERQSILKAVLQETGVIRISEAFDADGEEFFQAALDLGLEGIIAKKKDSEYTHRRSTDWLKIKVHKRHEVVIGGFTLNDDSPKKFSALLVGVYEGGRLHYTGKIGTGFNTKTQAEMWKLFQPLMRKTAPFEEVPEWNKPSRFRPNPPNATVTWLEPELVCEVSYTELTSEGIMRHPSFEGMRTDKDAKDVHPEKEQSLSPGHTEKHKGMKGKKNTEKTRQTETLLNPHEKSQVKTINRHSLEFSNVDKLYWPEDGYTKRDMLNYYHQVAEFILPYLKDRPLSLNRFPNGIHGHSFYQKDVTGKAPDWAKTFLYHTSDDEETDKHFLVGHDEATLLWAANTGCIEMNPWSSRIQKPDNPDFCIIDLDPDQQTFDMVIEAALVTKQVLDELKIPCYAKTSGSSGIHIFIPLGAQYDYEHSKEFARVLVQLVHERIPDYTTLERAVKDRKGKMYLDFLQNRPQATIACAYSLRPKPHASVSMPLHWDEVKKGLKVSDFNIENAPKRLAEIGDIFQPVLGKGIKIEEIEFPE